AGNGVQRVLDLHGTDLLPAAFDDVVRPALEVEETVPVHAEQVVRAEDLFPRQPARPEHVVRLLRQVPVTRHHVRTTHVQGARATGDDGFTVIVEQEYFRSGNGFAHRTRFFVHQLG